MNKLLSIFSGSLSALITSQSLNHISIAEKWSSKDEVSDVVVIGGGILGCSTAFWLAKAKKKVILLEKGTIACEASSLAAGTIPSRGPGKNLSWKDYLQHQSLEIYKSVMKDYNLNFDLSCSGALSIAVNAQEKKFARECFDRYTANGHDMKLLESPEEIYELEPALRGGSAVAALLHPHAAHLDPAAATHSFAQAAAMEGAIILEREQAILINEVQKNPPLYKVFTHDHKEFLTRAVVVSTGSTDSRLIESSFGMRLPIIPVKGQIWVTDQRQHGFLKHMIFGFGIDASEFWQFNRDNELVPKNTTHMANGKRLSHHVYGRQCADGTVLFGGDRIPIFTGTLDYKVEEELVRENYEHVREIIPNVGKMAGSYCCYMPFSSTKDGKPLLGNLFGAIYLAVGFGYCGMSLGPCAGQIMSKLICNEMDPMTEIVLKELNPCRQL